MAMTDLPNELVDEILEYLSCRDLSRWLRTNRQNAEYFTPVLYKRLERGGVQMSDHHAAVRSAVKNRSMGTLVKAATSVIPLPASDYSPVQSTDRESSASSLPYGNGLLHTLIDPFLPDLIRPQLGMCHSLRWAKDAGAALVHLAIYRGLDVNARDAEGRTPLMIACRLPSVFDARKVLRALLSRGADPSAVDKDGWTALHHATGEIRRNSPDGERQFLHEHACRYHMLLTYSPPGRIDASARNGDGRTPAHMLVEMRVDVARERYAVGNARDDLREVRLRALNMLLRRGASAREGPLAPGRCGGGTLLHLACDNGDAGLVALLLRQGAAADVNVPAADGYTPLGLVLLAVGQRGLHAAVRTRHTYSGQMQVVVRTLPTDSDRSTRDELPVIGRMLLRHGATADADAEVAAGYTGLMALAAGAAENRITRNELVDLSRFLLEAGADPGVRNPEGLTAYEVFMQKTTTRNVWVWEPCLEVLKVGG